MQRTYDVVIIGGGVIGSSLAFFLSSNPDFQGRIAVIERDPFYQASSSSLSTSAIRQQFGTPPNIQMSANSIEFLRDVRDRLYVEGHDADVGLREPGYLFLGAEKHVETFKAKHETQVACGFEAELFDRESLKKRFPWINNEDLAIASYGKHSEGWFDGPALLQAFRRKARKLGVEYIADTVISLDMDGSRVSAVNLESGDKLIANTVVNAAGPWAAKIARMAGVDVPVFPRKRCVFVFDSPEKHPEAPFIMDTSGFFLRPEGHLYICGITPEVENDDDDFELNVDYDLFDEMIWPALAHRIPGFEQLRMLRAWAGLYEYNTFDHSALIGHHPELSNLILVNGFSGHGMMHAPAAGLGVSELITYGAYRTLDLTPFRFERIAAGEMIEEHVY